ncbi:filamentous hemagglutinin N-terminal domain-containing protein [Roseibium sp. AS2]|uniref:two-partner secretion domain-containing protein n=1 Tax=Roseibium sp. AS2 TaxID=3135781 RepID=UPI00316F35BF
MALRFPNLPRILWATTALSSGLLFSQLALAGPNGEKVIAGSASVNRPSATKTEIVQSSSKAIINWNRFDIGKNEWTEFKQPDVNSITLNRVTGGNPSEILGTLTANGTVMLVNPDGILFGKGAQIDVGGLVATTNDIANSDFMNGRFHFNIPGKPDASIVNEGTITVRDTGIAAFVAPGVRNSGVISARLGSIGLAAGNGFTLDMYGDDLIKLKVDDDIASEVVDVATGQRLDTLVDNQGKLHSDGGTVALTAATARRVVDRVINNDGVIEANSVGTRNGKIILGAQTAATKTAHAPNQKVRVSGSLKADGVSSRETGGNVHITGEMIELQRANITARGDAGGGTILVGGDYLGGNPDPQKVTKYGIKLEDIPIPTAKSLVVDSESTLDASATTNGDGGKVVNWSDGETVFDGHIAARGGAQAGNGGFVEVSGRETVYFDNISTDLVAPNGNNGTILFDPSILVINSSNVLPIEGILNAGTNLITTGGFVSVQSDIIKTDGGSATWSISGDDGVEFKSGIVIGSISGKLNLSVDADADRLKSSGELNEAAKKYQDDLSLGLATDLAAYIATHTYDNTDRDSVETYAAGALDIIRDKFPESEEITIDEFVERLKDEGAINSSQLQEHADSVFNGSGASLLLNGGTLTVKDNSGKATITADPVPDSPTITQSQYLDCSSGPCVTVTEYDFELLTDPDGTLDLAVNFDPNSNSRTKFGQLPGAQVIDLRPKNPDDVVRNYQSLSLNAIVSTGETLGLAAKTLWNMGRQTGYLVLTDSGFRSVTREEGLALLPNTTPSSDAQNGVRNSPDGRPATTFKNISEIGRGAVLVSRSNRNNVLVAIDRVTAFVFGELASRATTPAVGAIVERAIEASNEEVENARKRAANNNYESGYERNIIRRNAERNDALKKMGWD